ncbi:MAG: ABC transporter substrate-binding protein [Anaerolineae bacterium]|nr:ABC transporter substrate-binding protein [Anaerolineae bacterium]
MTKRLATLVILAVLVLVAVAPAAAQGPSGELEIFSWWAGDEGPALQALIDEYQALYPDVTVNNATVTGGAGVNARAVLKTRMLGGDPPDTFQVHAGQELIGTWVVADRMEDLTFLFEEEGWTEKYPAGLLDLISTDEGIWSVPVNIHRSNVLWYSPAKIEELGIGVPASWGEFLEVCPTLQDAGVIPLVVGENWTVNHLWESVALAELGVEGWGALWTGEKSWTDDDVVAMWETFGMILDCTNIDVDAATLSWQQATDKMVAGEAAFNVMGDWAAGYMFTTLELEPGVDFGWAAAPGTEGLFMMLSDSFGLPQDVKNRDAAVEWLRRLGSAQGQDIFNPLKGSIAAHLDTDLTLYNAYLQSAAADWQANEVVGSLVHGAVANERFSGEFGTVMEIYLISRDPMAAANAAQAIAGQAGIGE